MVFLGQAHAIRAPVFPDAFAVMHRMLSIKLRVAPAVIRRGRVMSSNLVYGVPDHCNRFPNMAKEKLSFLPLYWMHGRSIFEDGISVLHRLPTEPVVLIGFRYGGLVAWWVSLIAPHRIKKLIVVGSIPSLAFFPLSFRIALQLPLSLLQYWRSPQAIERLRSVLRDFPLQNPVVPTVWTWNREDPYHRWTSEDMFVEENIRTTIVKESSLLYPTIREHL